MILPQREKLFIKIDLDSVLTVLEPWLLITDLRIFLVLPILEIRHFVLWKKEKWINNVNTQCVAVPILATAVSLLLLRPDDGHARISEPFGKSVSSLYLDPKCLSSGSNWEKAVIPWVYLDGRHICILPFCKFPSNIFILLYLIELGGGIEQTLLIPLFFTTPKLSSPSLKLLCFDR